MLEDFSFFFKFNDFIYPQKNKIIIILVCNKSSTSLEDVFPKINSKAVINDMEYIKITISFKNLREIKIWNENNEK